MAAVPNQFQSEHLADYMDALATLLTTAWTHDRTSEALLDEWKAHVAASLVRSEWPR